MEAKKILENFRHPTLQKNLIELGAISQCERVNQELMISLTMPFAWQTGFEDLKTTVTPLLLKLDGVENVNWNINYNIATLKRANSHHAIKNIKNIIAISSGKGGVGKSSTAVNLALALQKQGAKVGILDADIYGPSIPTMLGTEKEQPLTPDNKHMSAIMAYGLASNSIGYLVAADGAMVWRGPMASKALLQILQDTLWPELDYLVIDMPPGTGDIQLTLAQNIPVTAAVIVTTPQDGAKRLAEKYQTKLLGQMPLHRLLRQDLDSGQPTVVSHPDSEFTQLYCNIAAQVASQLYWQGETILPDISFKAL